MRRVSVRWHPYAVDPDFGCDAEHMMLVALELADVETGIQLTITDTGFERLSMARREAAIEANDGGWDQQARLIEKILRCKKMCGANHDWKRAAARRSAGHGTIFAALGDRYRLSIIARLSEDDSLSTIGLKGNGEDLSRQGITKHLRALESAGLIESFRTGRDRHWQLRSYQFANARACLEQVTEEWDARLKRLKSLVEDGDAQIPVGRTGY